MVNLFTAHKPSITNPSTGIFSLDLIKREPPILTLIIGISSNSFPFLIVANSSIKKTNLLIEFQAFPVEYFTSLSKNSISELNHFCFSVLPDYNFIYNNYAH